MAVPGQTKATATEGDATTGVVWFRRDLRLTDNAAVAEAVAAHRHLVALFVWDPSLLGPAGPARVAFLTDCLRSLDEDLGGRLVIRRGDPGHVVPEVAASVDADAVWSAADFGPYGSVRDRAVAEALESQGVDFHQPDTPYAVAPGSLHTNAGRPFQVFTPFASAWRAHGWDPPAPRPAIGVSTFLELPGEQLPEPAGDRLLPVGGETAALERLEQFARHDLQGYAGTRDRPDLDQTSRLSPYLKFGCVHPRQIIDRLDGEGTDSRRFITELCWREFYADVLFHRPDTARGPYRPEWASFPIDQGPDADARFEAWARGRTGVPIVDAGMRQLAGESWMHNRVRMIVASYLVKDLHLDWLRGARWFLHHLVDGDLASNQHGWQWVAGSGTDAAPYFRIFNPVVQGKRFDPEGTYIRRWVPELAGLPLEVLHEPWTVSPSLFAAAPYYPAPLVDHAQERQVSLARYRAMRDGAST
jgi:deoxyribodipyrimidine photo-lyase